MESVEPAEPLRLKKKKKGNKSKAKKYLNTVRDCVFWCREDNVKREMDFIKMYIDVQP